MVDTIALRAYATIILLIYASALDIRYREINRKAWLSMVFLGAIFLLMDVYNAQNPKLLIPFLFILSLAAVFSMLLSRLGLMGGGDAKLLIALGAMYPFRPIGRFILPTFFLSAFANAVLLALLVNIWIFVSNIKYLGGVRTPGDLLKLFSARKKDARDVGRFEAVLEEGKFFLNVKNTSFGGAGREGDVWAVPALPFAVFLTLGFIVAILYGDLLYFIGFQNPIMR